MYVRIENLNVMPFGKATANNFIRRHLNVIEEKLLENPNLESKVRNAKVAYNVNVGSTTVVEFVSEDEIASWVEADHALYGAEIPEDTYQTTYEPNPEDVTIDVFLYIPALGKYVRFGKASMQWENNGDRDISLFDRLTDEDTQEYPKAKFMLTRKLSMKLNNTPMSDLI